MRQPVRGLRPASSSGIVLYPVCHPTFLTNILFHTSVFFTRVLRKLWCVFRFDQRFCVIFANCDKKFCACHQIRAGWAFLFASHTKYATIGQNSFHSERKRSFSMARSDGYNTKTRQLILDYLINNRQHAVSAPTFWSIWRSRVPAPTPPPCTATSTSWPGSSAS